MGDRKYPIKFGPEWLRNYSREPSSTGSTTGRDSTQPGSSTSPPIRPTNTAPNPTAPKVLLAKLRYGREEMLALYDTQTAEAPAQLRVIDLLYQPRGKAPCALNTFEDESRDMRGQASAGGSSQMDRYGMGRGRPLSLDNRGRALSSTDGRGRARGFNRQTSLGRGASWHANARNSYSGMPDDDPNLSSLRTWSNNNPPSSGLRPTAEQAEWANNKLAYRNKRQTNTNWRQQPNREEGEEWRSGEGGRRQPDKWEREWPERTNQEKWTSNRRTWVGGETSEDALPEWAVENAEACGGTFDSSGAFHGYSNDDANIPKAVEPYSLTRSQTHGSFTRSKTAEEGSEEWWASEKAKKLSPKRFDASEIKFKKNPGADGAADKSMNSGGSAPATGGGTSTGAIPKTTSKARRDRANSKDAKQRYNTDNNTLDNGPDKKEHDNSPQDFMKNQDPNKAEKPFELDIDKPSDDKTDFQSVILPSNNLLRHKHQNIGTPTESPKKQTNKQMMQSFFDNNHTQQERDDDMQNEKEKNRIVEDMLKMNLDDDIPEMAMNELLISRRSSTTISPGLSSVNTSQIPNMQMKMNNAMLGLSQTNQNVPSSGGMQAPQSSMMQPLGITNSMLNASLGLPMPNCNSGISLQGVTPPSLANPGMLPSTLQGRGNNITSKMQGGQSSGLPSGMQMPGLLLANNLQGTGMPSNGMLPVQGMPGFQGANSMLPNMGNNSLFLGQGTANNTQLSNTNDIGNNSGTQNMFPMHGLSSTPSQPFNSSIFANMMSQPPPPLPNLASNLSDQWYYEDPNKTIQGPFSSKEMLNWLRAGFFSPSLMVRRACEGIMRPLGTYGPMPFGQFTDLMCPFPLGGFDPQQSHDNNLINQQPSLGLDDPTYLGIPSRRAFMAFHNDNTTNKIIHQAVASVGQFREMPNYFAEHRALPPPIPMPFPIQRGDNNSGVPTSIGMPSMPFIRRPHVAYNTDNPNLNMNMAVAPVGQFRGVIPNPFAEHRPLPPPIPMPIPHTTPEFIPIPEQNNRVESLWGQPSNNADMLWMQGANNNRNGNRVNNVPLYLWEHQPPPPIPSILPEDIAKEMKTEEEILAQMRASQVPVPPPPALAFLDDQPLPPVPNDFTASADLNMKELQKLIEVGAPTTLEENKLDKSSKIEQNDAETAKLNKSTDLKQKTPKVEEKKNKDNGTKPKVKKNKDEKKEEAVDAKVKDDEPEKRSAEPSPSSKNKKDDKSKKSELEKEKKEWIKEGFTIVKGAEKNKDSKKKVDDTKALEEAERKRKEEEKIAEIELRKRQMDTLRKQQEIQNQHQQQVRQAELISRKAPWSASNQGLSIPFPGPTLAEIQRLEREKKLEQMKEQQQMMQIIAQQQQAALAREQEMQAGLGWAKNPTGNTPSQTLAEIQAETRKQSAAAAVAAAAAREEIQITPPPSAVNIVPWGNTVNNGPISSMNTSGFWDTPLEAPKPVKPVEPPKQTEPKPKKKVTVVAPAKKEHSPSVDFDNWCTSALTSLRDSNIDVPTFITFLRDIESPYEVKDYVKCYLGDTKESGDFARQFLERRSRLLRVGMVTPSDDLCSPAIAINPRTNSGSDYTDVKNKANKKAKKNKMFKVDARNILGFSVTASEDRINVGDIDTV